jgi:hypothetical protein
MVRTQIQLPDDLYRDLKHLAEQKEWSLAETLRRAAEQLLDRHLLRTPESAPWRLPEARDLGWRGLDHAQVRAAAMDDMEAKWSEGLIS